MTPFLTLTGSDVTTQSVSFFALKLQSGQQFTAIELNTDAQLCALTLPFKPTIISLDSYPQLFTDLRTAFPSGNTEVVIQGTPVAPHHVDISSNTIPSPCAAWGRRPSLWWKASLKLDGPTIIAYTHSLRDDGLMFVPTDVKDATLFLANAPEGYGELSSHRGLGGLIRLDLVTLGQGRRFPRIDTLRRFDLASASTETPPTASYISTEPCVAAHRRDYVAMDGTLFSDLTNLKIVRYKPYQNKTYPLVAGCYMTEGDEGGDPFYFTGNQFAFLEKPGLLQMFEYPHHGSPIVYHINPGRYRKVWGKDLISYKRVPREMSVSVVPPIL